MSYVYELVPGCGGPPELVSPQQAATEGMLSEIGDEVKKQWVPKQLCLGSNKVTVAPLSKVAFDPLPNVSDGLAFSIDRDGTIGGSVGLTFGVGDGPSVTESYAAIPKVHHLEELSYATGGFGFDLVGGEASTPLSADDGGTEISPGAGFPSVYSGEESDFDIPYFPQQTALANVIFCHH